MAKERRKLILPIWGYVVLNFAFLAVMAGIFFFSASYSESRPHPVPPVGLLPVLFTCWVAFTLVSIFDAIFERAMRRREGRQIEESDSPSRAGGE